jgi:hypothetical protein
MGNYVTGLFLGIKRPGLDVDHQLVSLAEVRKEKNCTATPSLSLHGMLVGKILPYQYRVQIEKRGTGSTNMSHP